MKRYRKSEARHRDNNLFKNNQKTFFRKLRTTASNGEPDRDITPKAEDTFSFWQNMWGESVGHKKAKWQRNEKQRMSRLKTMLNWKINEEEVKTALSRSLNWKAPGPDGLQNFWLKKFTGIHNHLAKCYNGILENPESMPPFLTEGITYLLPKENTNRADPANYRPITCLPTLYKLLTSIISRKIYQHLESNKLLDEEQKGCHKGSQGCKEQLIVDSIITNSVKQKKGSLCTAYIDYQKAFDSVPHTWLSEVLEIYGVENHVKGFLRYAMDHWSTNLQLSTGKGDVPVGDIKIKRGIFQGDAFSPLWFCLAVKPLTSMLNRQEKGFKLEQPGAQVSHLFYMDDLKLYAENKNHLHSLLDCVGKFSSDVHMKFGLDKCRISCMSKGEWVEHPGYEVNKQQGTIKGMAEEEKYKYLGYLQSRGIDDKLAKEMMSNNYILRVRAILKTELSARNKAKAVNIYATSVLTYSFGILKWTDTELKNLDIKTRKEFCKARAHHPHSSMERFHMPRSEGGRGIPSVTTRHHMQVKHLRDYFLQKAKSSEWVTSIMKADRNATPLKLSNTTYDPSSKILTNEQQLERWRSKALHGRYRNTLENSEINLQASLAYLQTGNLFAETEGFVIAIQDQVIATRAYCKYIMHEDVQNANCRMCGQKEEGIDHIISGCSVLAPKQYLDRHNRVAKIIHQALRQKYFGDEKQEPYYSYDPPPIRENQNCRLYWNRPIITDKPIPNNIPDIVLVLKSQRTTYIIDIAVPLPANLKKTHTEKISKYLPLADEIKSMWGMTKVIVVPFVIGATGEIPKTLNSSIDILDLNRDVYISIQKSVILDTCSIVRRILGQQEVEEK